MCTCKFWCLTLLNPISTDSSRSQPSLVYVFQTKTSSEEEAEKLVADPGAEEEADARHVAQKTADCTINEHEPLPARNCRESCLRTRHLQMRCKKKSRSARKNASKVKFQKAGFVDMGRCAFRSGGGVLVTSVTGGGRTCVPDALCVLIPSLLSDLVSASRSLVR